MKSTQQIIIDKPIDLVWKVVAEEFDRAGDWMATIPKSYQKEEGEIVENSPMAGRVCELTEKPGGAYADESITLYDQENYRLGVRVVPEKAKVPVQKNDLLISLNAVSPNSTEVIWSSDVELKAMGKLLYPLIKAGLAKAFNEVLEELKYYVEEGKPHPRKQAKLKRAA